MSETSLQKKLQAKLDQQDEQINQLLNTHHQATITQIQNVLAHSKNEYTNILKNELNTIALDTQKQFQSMAWRTIRARLLWPFTMGIVLCLGLLLGSWASTQYLARQIHQIKEAQAQLAALKQQGGKIQWSLCGDRICAQIDTSAPPYQNDDRVLKEN